MAPVATKGVAFKVVVVSVGHISLGGCETRFTKDKGFARVALREQDPQAHPEALGITRVASPGSFDTLLLFSAFQGFWTLQTGHTVSLVVLTEERTHTGFSFNIFQYFNFFNNWKCTGKKLIKKFRGFRGGFVVPNGGTLGQTLGPTPWHLIWHDKPPLDFLGSYQMHQTSIDTTVPHVSLLPVGACGLNEPEEGRQL